MPRHDIPAHPRCRAMDAISVRHPRDHERDPSWGRHQESTEDQVEENAKNGRSSRLLEQRLPPFAIRDRAGNQTRLQGIAVSFRFHFKHSFNE